MVSEPSARSPEHLGASSGSQIPEYAARAKVLQPHTRYPDGSPVQEKHRLELGQALAPWGEGELGELAQAGKHSHGRFDDRLVAASATLIQQHWKPQPPPRWLTFVPSLHHPGLLADFARRLASALGVECREVLAVTRAAEPQKSLPDPQRRFANVEGVFEVAARGEAAAAAKDLATMEELRQPPLPHPVLLLDDVAGSLWTLTVVGSALRAKGVPAVHPFVLGVVAGNAADLAANCPFAQSDKSQRLAVRH